MLKAALNTFFLTLEIACLISPILKIRTLKPKEVNLSFILKVISSEGRLFFAHICWETLVSGNSNPHSFLGMCWKDEEVKMKVKVTQCIILIL